MNLTSLNNLSFEDKIIFKNEMGLIGAAKILKEAGIPLPATTSDFWLENEMEASLAFLDKYFNLILADPFEDFSSQRYSEIEYLADCGDIIFWLYFPEIFSEFSPLGKYRFLYHKEFIDITKTSIGHYIFDACQEGPFFCMLWIPDMEPMTILPTVEFIAGVYGILEKVEAHKKELIANGNDS